MNSIIIPTKTELNSIQFGDGINRDLFVFVFHMNNNNNVKVYLKRAYKGGRPQSYFNFPRTSPNVNIGPKENTYAFIDQNFREPEGPVKMETYAFKNEKIWGEGYNIFMLLFKLQNPIGVKNEDTSLMDISKINITDEVNKFCVERLCLIFNISFRDIFPSIKDKFDEKVSERIDGKESEPTKKQGKVCFDSTKTKSMSLVNLIGKEYDRVVF